MTIYLTSVITFFIMLVMKTDSATQELIKSYPTLTKKQANILFIVGVCIYSFIWPVFIIKRIIKMIKNNKQ